MPELPSEMRKSDIRGVLVSGTFLVLLGLLLAALGIFLLSDSHQEYLSLLSEDAHMLVQHTGLTIFYAAFPLFIGMLVIGGFALRMGLRGRRYPVAVSRKVMNATVVLIIVGLVGMFASRSIANNYWTKTFENHGYIRCSASFVITKQWFTVVWARNPSHCTDSQVRDMFRSFEYNLPDINAYLGEQAETGSAQVGLRRGEGAPPPPAV